MVNIIFSVNVFQASADFWSGLNNTADKTGYDYTKYKSYTSAGILSDELGKVLSVAITFLGVVFLGLMIYAGYTWMIARGNEQEVTKAKNIIIYAVIGLVVVLSAYAITQIVSDLWFNAAY